MHLTIDKIKCRNDFINKIQYEKNNYCPFSSDSG